MSDKLMIGYPIIVEGKYDKIKLSSIVEAQIIPTAGFGVFKNRELSQLLRKLSEKSMIIVLTDSDGGGKVIRSHISGMIPKDRLIQLYIPQIKGKESRKTAPGAQGLLGVDEVFGGTFRCGRKNFHRRNFHGRDHGSHGVRVDHARKRSRYHRRLWIYVASRHLEARGGKQLPRSLRSLRTRR